MRKENTVIINATNIGYRYNGIGMYSYNLINELTTLKTNLNFIIYVNRSAKHHIDKIFFPSNFEVRWVTPFVSPDYNFKGHLLRLLYSNIISLRHRRLLQLNTSQLEINFFRKNQIIMIHDVIPLLFKKFHIKQYFYYKLILELGIRAARCIITPSSHSKELLKSIYKLDDDKIKVIHNGAETVKPVNSGNGKSPYVLYVGRICRMKNIEGMIKAFELIGPQYPHKFIIVGDDRTAFEKIIRLACIDKEIAERIKFMQDISPEEKADLYSNASLTVFPSFYEGFGLPPVEAMAYGCPVVVSDNSSLPEICGDAAVYINPNDYRSIAAGMRELLQDPVKNNEFRLKAAERGKHFKWKYSALEHLEVLETAINYSKLPAKKALAVYAAE